MKNTQNDTRSVSSCDKKKKYNDIDSVITFENYNKALKACKHGVMWKASPQKYCYTPISNMYETLQIVSQGVIPELTNVNPITLYERGKERTIIPIAFNDRITQRVICDNSLIPLVRPTLINDNGASTKNKGVSFTRDRLDKFMRKMVNEYGEDFYILIFDFKSFFNSIPHQTCYDALMKLYDDPQIVDLIMQVVKSYMRPNLEKIEDAEIRKRELDKLENNQQRGICLGSEISQILALLVPNAVDHYIKDTCGIKYYIRYMDDGVLLHHDKEVLHQVYNGAKEVCDRLGLKFNDKKTHIVKASKGFTFLKIQYRVSGRKVIKTLSRSSITRMRRKLKKYRKLVDNGEMSLDDVYNSLQSWIGHAKIAKSYHTVKSMLKLYDELFDGYRITKRYEHLTKGGKDNGKVLQNNLCSEFRWDSDIAVTS